MSLKDSDIIHVSIYLINYVNYFYEICNFCKLQSFEHKLLTLSSCYHLFSNIYDSCPFDNLLQQFPKHLLTNFISQKALIESSHLPTKILKSRLCYMKDLHIQKPVILTKDRLSRQNQDAENVKVFVYSLSLCN